MGTIFDTEYFIVNKSNTKKRRTLREIEMNLTEELSNLYDANNIENLKKYKKKKHTVIIKNC